MAGADDGGVVGREVAYRYRWQGVKKTDSPLILKGGAGQWLDGRPILRGVGASACPSFAGSTVYRTWHSDSYHTQTAPML